MDGQTDESDLGYSYDEMEHAIEFCLNNYDIMDEINKPEILEFVWNRHIANRHKHKAPPTISLK